MDTINKLNRVVNHAASVIAGLIVLLLMTITIVDVTGRYVFNHPLRGSVEMSTELLVIMTFLCVGYLQVHKRHIVVDFLNESLPKKQLERIDWVIDFTCLFVLGLIAFQTIGNAIESWRMQEASAGSLSIPFAPARTIIALGMVMFTVSLLLQIIERILSISAKESPAAEVSAGTQNVA